MSPLVPCSSPADFLFCLVYSDVIGVEEYQDRSGLPSASSLLAQEGVEFLLFHLRVKCFSSGWWMKKQVISFVCFWEWDVSTYFPIGVSIFLVDWSYFLLEVLVNLLSVSVIANFLSRVLAKGVVRICRDLEEKHQGESERTKLHMCVLFWKWEVIYLIESHRVVDDCGGSLLDFCLSSNSNLMNNSSCDDSSGYFTISVKRTTDICNMQEVDGVSSEEKVNSLLPPAEEVVCRAGKENLSVETCIPKKLDPHKKIKSLKIKMQTKVSKYQKKESHEATTLKGVLEKADLADQQGCPAI